jgi:hypothetical protein
MSAPGGDSMRGWRWLFLIAETVVAGGFASLMLLKEFWGLPDVPQSHAWPVILGGLFMLAWLFLLVASPFFLRSLRGVALAGWIIAFGLLVMGMLTS